jgi:hypothetical protein
MVPLTIHDGFLQNSKIIPDLLDTYPTLGGEDGIGIIAGQNRKLAVQAIFLS